MTAAAHRNRRIRTEVLVVVAVAVGLLVAVVTRMPRGRAEATTTAPAAELTAPDQTTPEAAVGALLEQLRGQLRALARGDRETERALRHASAALVDLRAFRAEVERRLGTTVVVEQHYALTQLINWGAMIAYYVDELDPSAAVARPARGAVVEVAVPVARGEFRATILAECQQGDDGLWRVFSLRFGPPAAP